MASASGKNSEEDSKTKKLKLEQCLTLLRGSQDEQVFAGLFLLTKLSADVLPPVSDDSETWVEVRSSLDPVFLQRLLTSSGGPIPDTSYQQVGLSVLLPLSMLSKTREDPGYISLIDTLVPLMEDQAVQRTAVQCLHSLCDSDEGEARLAATTGAPFTGLQSVLSCLSIVSSKDSEGGEDDDLLGAVSSLYTTLIQSSVFAPAADGDSLPTDAAKFFDSLCTIMATPKVSGKLKVTPVLAAVVNAMSIASQSSGRPAERAKAFWKLVDKSWSTSVRRGVQEILTSRLPATHRDPALILAGQCVNLCGDDWLFPANLRKVSDEHRKFFRVLLALCKIEIGLGLKQAVPRYNVVRAGLAIVRGCMHALIKIAEFEGPLPMDPTTIQQIQRDLTDTFEAMYPYIASAKGRVVDTGGDGTGIPLDDPLLSPVVSLWCEWMVEDTEGLRTEAADILDVLVAVSFNAAGLSPSSPSSKTTSPTDVANATTTALSSHSQDAPAIIPALLDITADDDLGRAFISGPSLPRLVDFIHDGCTVLSHILAAAQSGDSGDGRDGFDVVWVGAVSCVLNLIDFGIMTRAEVHQTLITPLMDPVVSVLSVLAETGKAQGRGPEAIGRPSCTVAVTMVAKFVALYMPSPDAVPDSVRSALSEALLALQSPAVLEFLLRHRDDMTLMIVSASGAGRHLGHANVPRLAKEALGWWKQRDEDHFECQTLFKAWKSLSQLSTS